MLQHLDAALEHLIRSSVRVARSGVDVAFETPDATWGSTVIKPTLNVFLWDIRKSAEEGSSGRERVMVGDGERYRMRPPRIDFQYLLTAWAGSVADEHELLGGCLVDLLGCQTLEGANLGAFVREGDPPPTIRVARTDGKDLAEFWGAIDGKLRPGVNLVVTATVDPELHTKDEDSVGLATTKYEVKSFDKRNPNARSRRHRFGGRIDAENAIGAVVRSPRGKTTVGPDGTFLLDAEPGDEIVIESDPRVTIVVPKKKETVST